MTSDLNKLSLMNEISVYADVGTCIQVWSHKC